MAHLYSFGINITVRHESQPVCVSRAELVCNRKRKVAAIFQGGYFIDKCTKDALTDEFDFTLYIPFHLERSGSTLASFRLSGWFDVQ